MTAQADCGLCRQESPKEMAVNYEIPFSVKHKVNYPWPNRLWLQRFWTDFYSEIG